jgi:hypothetical protein
VRREEGLYEKINKLIYHCTIKFYLLRKEYDLTKVKYCSGK